MRNDFGTTLIRVGLRIESLALAVLVVSLALTSNSTAQQESAQDAKPIICSLGSDLVVLTATVENATGHPVTNLSHNDFLVFDNGEPQRIDFFTREDQARSIGIVFDRSTSVSTGDPKWFGALCQSLVRSKDQSNPENEYFLIGADHSPKLITDWTRDSDALIEGLSRLAFIRTKGGSAVYDACLLARQKMNEHISPAIILLISDGQDGASQSSCRDLQMSLKKPDVLLYSLCPANAKGSLALSGRDNLKKLSAASGGAAYFLSSSTAATDAVARIGAQLRHQYLIGYYPSDVRRDGRWHSVIVTANSANDPSRETSLVVRTRPGYYALNELRALR